MFNINNISKCTSCNSNNLIQTNDGNKTIICIDCKKYVKKDGLLCNEKVLDEILSIFK